MKQFLIIAVSLLTIAGTGSCTKKNKCIKEIECNGSYSGNMEVVKDCTGAYVRFNGVDYQVCNANLLENYGSGTTLAIGFNRISFEDCNPFYLGICNMAHEHDGLVEITCINAKNLVAN